MDGFYWQIEYERKAVCGRIKEQGWNQYIDKLRAEKIVRDLDLFNEDSSKDPVLLMITKWYDDYESCDKMYFDKTSFEQQVDHSVLNAVHSKVFLLFWKY